MDNRAINVMNDIDLVNIFCDKFIENLNKDKVDNSQKYKVLLGPRCFADPYIAFEIASYNNNINKIIELTNECRKEYLENKREDSV